MTAWTDAEDTKLRDMRKDGKSFAYCAKHLPGRNRSACLGRAHRLKLPTITPDLGRVSRADRNAKPGRRLPKAGDGLPPRKLDDREHAIDDICLLALDHLSGGWTAADVAALFGVAAGELTALLNEVEADRAAEAAKPKHGRAA